MTYSHDYPDVDPSVHPGPITHREYTSPFLPSSFSLSPTIGERIDHRCAHDFSSESLYQKKPIEIEKPFRRLGMQNEAFYSVRHRPLLFTDSFRQRDSLNN